MGCLDVSDWEKKSQMEIVSDHLCHFPSKSLFGGMCKIKFPFPDLDLLGWYPTILVFPWSLISFSNKNSIPVPALKNEENTAILGRKRSVKKIEFFNNKKTRKLEWYQICDKTVWMLQNVKFAMNYTQYEEIAQYWQNIKKKHCVKIAQEIHCTNKISTFFQSVCKILHITCKIDSICAN